MSILGIGTWELLMIILLVVVILGPERAREAGMGVGRFIKRLTSSEFWRELVQAAHFMQQLPQNLVRMAELEEITGRLNREMSTMQQDISSIASPLEKLTPARLFQEPLRSIESIDQDLREAVTGKPPAAPAPVPAGPPPAADYGPGSAAERGPVLPGPSPEPAVGPAGANRGAGEQDRRYAAEWPALLQRLDEIERRQAELAEQLRALQTGATAPGEASTGDEHL